VAAGGDKNGKQQTTWTRVIVAFEHGIVTVLMALLMCVVAVSTFELGSLLFRDLGSLRRGALDIDEMFSLFGFFLLVLVGLELLTTLKTYVREGIVQVEVVLEVSLIALAQKVIILNTSHSSGVTLLGVAALVLTLAVAYWLVRSARR